MLKESALSKSYSLKCNVRLELWLGDRDSNPDKQSQSLLSYR